MAHFVGDVASVLIWEGAQVVRSGVDATPRHLFYVRNIFAQALFNVAQQKQCREEPARYLCCSVTYADLAAVKRYERFCGTALSW
jgi:hypothetical protein